jgi:RIO kinase 1
VVRDVGNLSATLGRFAPELLATRHAEEMWALFAAGELRPDTVLTGTYVEPEAEADVAGTLVDIEDAREEAIRRQLGREAAARP